MFPSATENRQKSFLRQQLCALRHDWVCHWNEMFGVMGIKPSPGMAAREKN
jgi:hypothetical protein